MGTASNLQVHINPISAATRAFTDNPLWFDFSNHEDFGPETLREIVHAGHMPYTAQTAAADPSPYLKKRRFRYHSARHEVSRSGRVSPRIQDARGAQQQPAMGACCFGELT
jgi:hypothetical protein